MRLHVARAMLVVLRHRRSRKRVRGSHFGVGGASSVLIEPRGDLMQLNYGSIG